MKKSTKKGIVLAAAALTLTLTATVAAIENKDVNTLSLAETSTMEQEIALPTAVLKQGASGSEVREVQRRLKLWGYYNGSVDGVFGKGTRAAVIAFQKNNGLTADGVVGKATYKALGMNSSYQALVGNSTSSQSQGTNGFSSSDVYLLARTIYAEGRGEPYTGQVAIGAVVLNRVRSSSFPNTIAGVVYQKHAFTAVSDGQINLTPNETAMKAARDALNGWDPTGGALYYYNPAVATSAWIFDRQTVTVIGKHVFAI
ncbi:MAG: spore cortex-lytic enzyme [Clostridiales bacterium]|nr:spore cortex-lytic enzyme [Clostridiales bacterium]